MKTLTIIVSSILLLSGCAHFYDAPRLDADFGQAQAKVWEKQVAFSDYRYAGRSPEGLGGIPSEQVMKVYNQSFGEKSQVENVFNLGLTGDK